MSVITRSQGKLDANTFLPDNVSKDISAEDTRQRIIDLWDSSIMKKGDTGIQAVLSYSTNFAFSNDTDLVSKKYVDDAIGGYTPTGFIKADGTIDFAGDQSMGGFSLTHIGGLTDTSDVSFIDPDNRFLKDTSGFLVARFSSVADGFGVSTSSFFGYFKTDNLTTDKTFNLPDQSGTVALVSDIEIYFVGYYASLAALQSAHPTGMPGEYGIVDAGVGSDAQMYVWDDDDNDWVSASGTGGVTSFNSRVGAVVPQSGDYTTSIVAEGSNLYFTNGRVDSRVQSYNGDVTLTGTTFAVGASKITNAMLAGSINPNKVSLSTGQIIVGNSGVGAAVTPSLSATPGSLAIDASGVFTLPDATESIRGFVTAANFIALSSGRLFAKMVSAPYAHTGSTNEVVVFSQQIPMGIQPYDTLRLMFNALQTSNTNTKTVRIYFGTAGQTVTSTFSATGTTQFMTAVFNNTGVLGVISRKLKVSSSLSTSYVFGNPGTHMVNEYNASSVNTPNTINHNFANATWVIMTIQLGVGTDTVTIYDIEGEITR